MNPPWETIALGVLMFAAMAAYALFSGADFGGGIWDLVAGGDERGEKPRAAIDASVTPVWEGNHVWIIFGLVILWTAFPPAFAAIMIALFVPLALSLLGIVLRGVGFAFRHEAERLPMKRLSGALFAASSVMTPFFLGVCVGAVATGSIPAHPQGNELEAWTSPTSVVTGLLFVAACAYIGGVYLVADSDRRHDHEMIRYFRRRAMVAGIVTGALAAVNMVLLHGSAPYLWHRLFGPALPAVAVSVAAGVAALALIFLNRPNLLRIAAGLAVVGVVAGWGVAQYPYLLPGQLTLTAGAEPLSGQQAELAVMILAAALVVPSFVWLYWLQQHGRLVETGPSEGLKVAVATENARDARPSPPPPERHRTVRAVVYIAAASLLVRETARRLLRRVRQPFT
jgi:cytochrome bd ubiquinol oxidase subunit II